MEDALPFPLNSLKQVFLACYFVSFVLLVLGALCNDYVVGGVGLIAFSGLTHLTMWFFILYYPVTLFLGLSLFAQVSFLFFLARRLTKSIWYPEPLPKIWTSLAIPLIIAGVSKFNLSFGIFSFHFDLNFALLDSSGPPVQELPLGRVPFALLSGRTEFIAAALLAEVIGRLPLFSLPTNSKEWQNACCMAVVTGLCLWRIWVGSEEFLEYAAGKNTTAVMNA